LFFSITLFLTNNFNTNDVGEYDFSRSILLFLGGFAVFGMHQSIVYYSGHLTSLNGIDYLKRIYGKMIIILLALTIVVVAITHFIDDTLFNSFFEKDVSTIIKKTVLAIFFYSLTILNIDTFRAVDKIITSEIYRNVIRYSPFLIAAIIIFNVNLSHLLVEMFLLNFVLTALISTTQLLLYFSKVKVSNHSIKISYSSILKRSGPMAISTMAFILMQAIDVILLGKFTGFEEIAIYAVAMKLTLLISLVLASVNSVQAPIIAEYYSGKKIIQLRDLIKKATKLTFILTLPGIVALALFPKFVLSLFGPDYTAAKVTLLILLIGQAVNTLCGSVGVYMNMTGKQMIFQQLLVSALIINIFLNWLLIPKYGINGAAFATSISMIFWNVIAVVYIYKKDKVKTFFTFR